MTEDEKAWGQAFVENAVSGKPAAGLLVMHLGAEGAGKRWPGENARRVLAMAVARGYRCFLFDGQGVTSVGGVYPDGVTLVRGVNHNETMAIIAACDVILCVDNAIFNIGKHFQKVTVPLFGFKPDYYAKVASGQGAACRFANNYTPDPSAVFEAIDAEKEIVQQEIGEVCGFGEVKTFEI